MAPDIEITLLEKELAGQLAGGDLSAKGALNASLEVISGSAEVEWTSGNRSEASLPFAYDFLGSSFTGSGKLKGFEEGLGMTWDYEIQFRTQAVASTLWNWLPAWSTLSRLAATTTGLFGYSSTTTDEVAAPTRSAAHQ